MSDEEDQADEVLAVSEILPPGTFEVKPVSTGGHTGSVDVCVDLVDPVQLTADNTFSVRYLPPVHLDFTLPPTYPSTDIPQISVSCAWLSEHQLEDVKSNLKNIAQENLGSVVLFLWINFLQQDVLNAINFDNSVDLQQVRSSKTKKDTKKISSVPSTETKISFPQDELSRGNRVGESNRQVDQPNQKLHQSSGGGCKAADPTDAGQDRLTGIVETWSIDEKSGSIVYDGGTAPASMNDITAPNLDKLEVSLEEGEMVEFQLVNSNTGLKAVNISGPNRLKVKGNRNSEDVWTVSKDALGFLEKWNSRNGDGLLRTLLSDGTHHDTVYVYHTSLHMNTAELPQMMNNNQLYRYNIVDCGRYGKIAQFVRVQDILYGTVKKWRENDGRGWIRLDKHEVQFFAEDVLDIKQISKGSEVSFSLRHCKRKKTHAVSVKLREHGDRSLVSGQAATKVAPSAETKDCDTTPTCDQNQTSKGCDVMPTRSTHPEAETDPGLKILAARLREYNNMKEEEMFSVSCFSCLVCFSEKTGQSCVRFAACSHVYCRECMAQYFEVQIKGGQVKNLTCPTDDCKTQALPTQVEELVSPALFKKYENMLLETTLESMVDIITCPRVFCQCPTVIDRENNMGECPSCQLSFCIYCMATYHGVSPCKIKTKEHKAILEKYNQGTDDDKAFLERRYGKAKLRQLMDNVLSESYLSENAQNCPHCNAPIEKNDGCNKMTCWRCSTNFCWLCGAKLPASNPYSHFNVIGGNCYGNLFQGVDPGMDDDEWENFIMI